PLGSGGFSLPEPEGGGGVGVGEREARPTCSTPPRPGLLASNPPWGKGGAPGVWQGSPLPPQSWLRLRQSSG
ncbi:unnamed protein product, partial [Discosporangium mesarthrocarpum]